MKRKMTMVLAAMMAVGLMAGCSSGTSAETEAAAANEQTEAETQESSQEESAEETSQEETEAAGGGRADGDSGSSCRQPEKRLRGRADSHVPGTESWHHRNRHL